MSTDDNDVCGDLDKSNLKFIYEQLLGQKCQKQSYSFNDLSFMFHLKEVTKCLESLLVPTASSQRNW